MSQVDFHDASVALKREQAAASIRPTRGSYFRIGKRLADLIACVFLLPICVPLIGVFWLLTRRDGGPGFFLQDRVGRNGEIFKCYKLRTMVVDAEAALAEICAADPELAAEWKRDQKLRCDPRITPLGNFLRKTSIDELPQVFNVLLGDMSLVGPRPMMPCQRKMYTSAGGGTGYFALRPGITGPWQVDGRGETAFVDRIGYDNRYLSELSFGKDLSYLARTVTVVFRQTGG
ncbi:sugar transferase [Psychromarinibacter sp. S121]|uniref:sugar transferase n=1 Tax=Psychromarinibacter sp. S121 TaxID=3415127 RepID=UPI003C7CF724